jgi:hypothetical protein
LVAATAGNALIRSGAVFNWADMDWQRGFGHLSVWSPASGGQELGITLYSEALVAASPAGVIVYPASEQVDEDAAVADGGMDAGVDAADGGVSARPVSTQLMLAEGDVANARVHIPNLGLGSETT